MPLAWPAGRWFPGPDCGDVPQAVLPCLCPILAAERLSTVSGTTSTTMTGNSTPIRFPIGIGKRRWKICGDVPRSWMCRCGL